MRRRNKWFNQGTKREQIHSSRYYKRRRILPFLLVLVMMIILFVAWNYNILNLKNEISIIGEKIKLNKDAFLFSSSYCDKYVIFDDFYVPNMDTFYPILKYEKQECSETCQPDNPQNCVLTSCIKATRITWRDGNEILYPAKFISNGIWKDSTIASPLCRIGTKKGENTNYLYCENFGYSSVITRSDGVIQDKIYYSVNFVVDRSRIEKNVYLTTPGSTHTVENYKLPVVSSSCNSITEEEYNNGYVRI